MESTLSCHHRLGPLGVNRSALFINKEKWGLTCTVGVTGVEVQGKFMGDLRARIKMSSCPYDHLFTQQKGIMVCTSIK